MRHALASTLVLTLTACGPAASPAPSSPRTTASSTSAAQGAGALDACAGLPRPSAPPAPKPPSISLDPIVAEAQARSGLKRSGPPLELGSVSDGAVASWSTLGGGGPARVEVSRPRVPLDLAVAALPAEAGAALRRQHAARAALAEVQGWADASKQGCFNARLLEMESADGKLRATLAALRSPIADVLAAELALGEASSLEDPHLADLALDEVLARTARARAASPPGELAGFFARALRVEALRALGSQAEASAEAATLIGVPAPNPSLRGEAELRAAELVRDEGKSGPLFLAAVTAAQDNRVLGFAARAGAIAAIYEDDPEAARRLLDELVAAPPEGLEDDVDEYAASAYARVLPHVPIWWERPLPQLSPATAQHIAETLAAESERRGDRELARALLPRAEALGPLAALGQATRKKLSAQPTKPTSREGLLRERVERLRGQCALLERERTNDDARPLHRDLSFTLDARGVTVRAHPDDAAFAACLERWAPGFLAGAPALHATFSAQPVRRPAIRSTAAGTKP